MPRKAPGTRKGREGCPLALLATPPLGDELRTWPPACYFQQRISHMPGPSTSSGENSMIPTPLRTGSVLNVQPSAPSYPQRSSHQLYPTTTRLVGISSDP